MMVQTPGKIFLAEQRGLVETAAFRRYSTFSFGSYRHPDKQPFGRLLALNDETLAGGQQTVVTAPRAAQVLLLPITGALWAGLVGGEQAMTEVEHLQLLTVPAGGQLQFTNPYYADTIRFLHVWLAPPAAADAEPVTRFFRLPLPPLASATLVEAVPTEQPSPLPPLPFRVQVGRFAGRAEAECALAPGAGLFALVLAGAFEIAGRLLHAHDGLALWQTPTVELEALSPDAVVLLLTLDHNCPAEANGA